MNKHTRSVSLIDGHIERMTDAEVKKALECCIYGHGCEGCPYIGKGLCNDKLKRDALDLINRQQAEIKQLETIERVATKTIEKQDAEIELLHKTKQLIKSEAIKEFERKIKAHAYYIDYPKEHRVIDEDDLCNLVKEMTEEEE